MPKTANVNKLIDAFVSNLANALDHQVEVRAREAVVSAFGGGRATVSAVMKPRRKVSPHLKLAGRYMGLLRRMKKGEQKQIKGVRATQGVEAAIELMNQMSAARA